MSHENKHTPGPWSRRVDSRGWWRIAGPCARIEPKAGRNPAEREANARLIVAAPDLLAAAQSILMSSDYDSDTRPLMAALSAAVRKATV